MHQGHRPRARRGIAMLLEIIVVAVLILGAVVLYLSLNKGADKTQQALDEIDNAPSAVQTPPRATAPASSATPSPATPAPAGAAPTTGGAPAAPLAGGPTAQSVPGQVVQRAQGVKCKETLGQLRNMLAMAKTEDGTYPAALSGAPDTDRVRACPNSGMEYTYDPATGEVHCPYEPHARY